MEILITESYSASQGNTQAQQGRVTLLLPGILALTLSRPQGSVSSPSLETCPKIRVKCEVEERSECTRHRHCPDKMKCCLFNCGKKCLDLRKDVCSMPKETGPCLAFIPRWWYDKEREICTEFIYGGCNGNNNNFQTEAICLVICQDRESSHWIG
uniref:BPTI/Kunitz inhibitor domain-containing protein n=1 Tax=Oryctolagus cuniculus TaxID=9986 RepID=A0A5F9D3Y9_RABIT